MKQLPTHLLTWCHKKSCFLGLPLPEFFKNWYFGFIPERCDKIYYVNWTPHKVQHVWTRNEPANNLIRKSLWSDHGNYIGIETLFQIVQATKTQRLSIYWLNKTSRHVVIFINRQRTNKLFRLKLLIGCTNRTDWHTYWLRVAIPI